jgi:hypothetical protein
VNEPRSTKNIGQEIVACKQYLLFRLIGTIKTTINFQSHRYDLLLYVYPALIRAKLLRAAGIRSELFEHNQNMCKLIDTRTHISQHQDKT